MNSNVLKDKERIAIFERIRCNFQCLKGRGANSSVRDKVRILVFGGIRCEIQRLKR